MEEKIRGLEIQVESLVEFRTGFERIMERRHEAAEGRPPAGPGSAPAPGPGRFPRGHPKSPERDWDRLLLLREVRALGAPYIPRTRLDAWLVHAVAGEENGALPSSPVSGAGGDAPSESGARGSSLQLQAQEEGAGGAAAALGAEPSPGGRDCPTLGDVDLKTGQEALDYYYLHKGSEQSESQDGEKIKQSNRNSIDSSPFLGDYLLLLTSQTENALELEILEVLYINVEGDRNLEVLTAGEWTVLVDEKAGSLKEISLGATQPVACSSSRGMNSLSSYYTVNLTQAISHDVSLHEAMLLRSNHSTRVNPEIRSIQRQDSFLHLNSSIINPESLLHGTNWGLPPSIDIRNLTNQNLLSDLDENIFEEINLMALPLEGFDPREVSQLFEKPDSDSGLSSQSTTSSSNSDLSSVSTCNEGAVGYSSNIEYTSHDGLGAVGGHYPEHSKHCQMDYQSDSDYCGESPHFNIFFITTLIWQLPNELASTSEHHSSSSRKSNKVKGSCLNSTDNLSHDECHVKALRIPFSVDEIVSMPIDAFNNMLSKFYLTDTEISLMISDIRRKGKNKAAAQNCRKCKLDVILNLEEDVCKLHAQKESLKKQKFQCNKSISLMKQKLSVTLYHVVFSRLRDDQGRPVNPSQYALHCGSNGSILIIPKRPVTSEQKQDNQEERKQK
ncbi:LOW QUALITY PROTEIN: nuclear factor erythroid 2-related factor 3 [Lepidochelys kempii]|uniref:LOW QUALITY PROTEIN: nuclear factor erythroid 2-related factor 3 n=1 Tax=Lepidochelys kempii TaxID=8472 RepID=UPI003C6F2D76